MLNWNNSSIFASLIALLIIAPVFAVFYSAFLGDTSLWPHLFSTVLPRYISNTIILMLGVGLLSTLLGVSTAWVVTRYEFFGKNFFQWALLLPAAVPAYIIAYTYTDFLEYAGPVQKILREFFNFQNSNEYWFPEIRSMEGAIFVMSFVLYPYVYMTTRASFLTVPVSFFQTSLIYGRSSFFSVALPLARPGIIAGVALVLMETISDFGTVEYFALETLTLGVFNVWLGMNSLSGASQISSVLFVFVVVLLTIEYLARRRQRYHEKSSGQNMVESKSSSKFQKIVCFFICLIPIIIGFVIAIGMTSLSFVVGERKPDNEKLSPYECGFEAFDDARGRFDVRFYLVAILFIIFDLEVAFLFPWAISLGSIGVFGFWSMMIFLLILTIGFIYEWKKGALEWE